MTQTSGLRAGFSREIGAGAVVVTGFAQPVPVKVCCRIVRAMAGELLDLTGEPPGPGRNRSRMEAHGRQIAMYLCHVGLRLPQSEVARAFGRDRTTVGHACHVVEDRRDDPAYDGFVVALGRLVAVVLQLEGDAHDAA